MKSFLFLFLLTFSIPTFSQQTNIAVNFDYNSKTLDTIKVKYQDNFAAQIFDYIPKISIDSIFSNIISNNNKLDSNYKYASSIWIDLKDSGNTTLSLRLEYFAYNYITTQKIGDRYFLNLRNINFKDIESRCITSKTNHLNVSIYYYDINDNKFKRNTKIIQFVD